MNHIKVSVIVLSYNQEKYIRQTLDSILSQQHPYTYEIIICDDASKDSTPQIISDYAYKYPVITAILRERNLGVVKNYYDAISRCKGEYMMVCGGDDYYLPGKIKSQIEYLDNHSEIGLIHGDVQSISEDGLKMQIMHSHAYSSLEELVQRYVIHAPTMTVRMKILKEYIHDVNPAEHDWLMEDFPISLWFQAHNQLEYFPEVFVNYRIIEGSICHPNEIEKILNFNKSEFSVMTYFQAKFPDLLSLKCIYRRQLLKLLSNQLIVSSYPDYCFSILKRYKELDNNFLYYKYSLRIKYPLINRIAINIEKIKQVNMLKFMKGCFQKFFKNIS